MARTRSLKPGFFHDASLIDLPPLARLLFAGLWCYADRSGRLKDKPGQIKCDILPRDECDVDKLLQLLASGVEPFIYRYSDNNGHRFIQIRNFSQHQNPHMKEPASTIPAPDKPSNYAASPVQAPDEHGASPALTLNPITLTRSKNSIERKATADGFDRFWAVVWRKVNKLGALKAWPGAVEYVRHAHCTDSQPKIDIVRFLVEQAEKEPQRSAVPGNEWRANLHPATWLRWHRWEDEVTETTVKSSRQAQFDSIMEKIQ